MCGALIRAWGASNLAAVHPVEVIVTSPEAKQDGVAEFVADGRTFAFTVLEADELGISFVPRDDGLALIVGARSLLTALEHARALLS
jgi:hypothetical protein